MPLSAIVITYNEAHNIARCLQSLIGLADEIIVVDSFSTDDTIAIAKGFGAKVYQHKFEGYGKQKAIALDYTTNRWVMYADADEVVSDKLKVEILTTIGGPKHAAYEIPNLTNYCGAWIRHSGWYPGWRVRLWDTNRGHHNTNAVHEGWELNDKNDTIGRLKGDMLHYSFPTISSHIKKIEQYSEIGARFDVARGRKVSLIKLIVAPRWQFIKTYIFQAGFLDGYYGLVVCRNSAFASWAKYIKIRQYTKMKEGGEDY